MMKGHVGRFCLNSYSRLLWPSIRYEYRISQLLGKANDIAACVRGDRANAGTWNDRFGFEVSSVGIESIEFTEQSRQLVQQFASNRMNVAAYEGVSQQAGNMAAQQRIAKTTALAMAACYWA